MFKKLKGGASKMGVLEKKSAEDSKTQTEPESFEGDQTKPIIATARSGLSGVESALMRRLPSSYAEKLVKDALSYMIESEAKDDEAATVTSLRNELGAAGSVVVINGRNAKLTDSVGQYLVDKSKDVGGRTIHYHELEMEISAVQQGGYRF